MAIPQTGAPLAGPEFYRRARAGGLKVGDPFVTHEAAGGAGYVKSIVGAGRWIVEATYRKTDGSPNAGMVALSEFRRVYGFRPSEGAVYPARTRDGEEVRLRIARIRRTTRSEATFTLYGGKVRGWGTDNWRAGCHEADLSIDPLDAGFLGTGRPEDPFLVGLGLPDPFAPGAPSLSSLVKWRKGDADRRAFGHPKDPSMTFRPQSLDMEMPGGGHIGDILPSNELNPATAAVTAIEARRVRDALEDFSRKRPANAAAVERLVEGLSRREAARRHPPATAKAVEKAEEKLDMVIAQLRGRAG